MSSHFHLLTPRKQQPIQEKAYHQWAFPNGTIWTLFYRNQTSYLLRFPELADFQISTDGQDVYCTPAIDISAGSVEHLYQNQVLPLVLSKQGKQVFHASAVETPDGAIAFMGESGRGKSTLAAAFATSGLRFLTDDGLILDDVNGDYFIQPSHASIRLWSDSQEALISDTAPLAAAVTYTPKVRILSDSSMEFCHEARILSCIYFLGDGSAKKITISSLHPSDAMINLVKHSFLLDMDSRETISIHFEQLAKMVSLPIFFHLDYPRDYTQLANVRQAILEHAMLKHNDPPFIK